MGKSEEKKDTVEKEFVSFPDIAADAINVLLYEGKKIADAQKLLAGPTETIYQGKEKLRSQYEDLCKYELAEGNSYRSDRKIVHKAALIKMIKVLSGEMDTEDVEKWLEEEEIREEDEVTVCELFDQYERRGRVEGIVEGEKKGIEKGENRFAMLAQILMDGGRNDDLRRAIADRGYREQLYMEVKLS